MKADKVLTQETDYLGLRQTTQLKGLLALGVLLSHTAPASGVFAGSVLSPLIGSFGYLCVSVFFFLSGYGIMTQYQAKKERYLNGFLNDRVLSIYLLTVFLVLVYGAFHAIVGNKYSLVQVLRSLTFGDTIVNNGWYLQVVLLFYILWYLCVKQIPQQNVRSAVLSAAVLAYMVIGALTLSGTWWECSLCFLLGVFWQERKEWIDGWLAEGRRQLVVLAAAMVGFGAAFVLANKRLLPERVDGLFRMTVRCISSPLFVILVIMLIIYIRVRGQGLAAVLHWLGERSLGIYVLQGIALQLFRSPLNVDNGWVYMACVMTGTLVLATVLHPVIRFVTGIPKNYLQRGK